MRRFLASQLRFLASQLRWADTHLAQYQVFGVMEVPFTPDPFFFLVGRLERLVGRRCTENQDAQTGTASRMEIPPVSTTLTKEKPAALNNAAYS